MKIEFDDEVLKSILQKFHIELKHKEMDGIFFWNKFDLYIEEFLKMYKILEIFGKHED